MAGLAPSVKLPAPIDERVVELPIIPEAVAGPPIWVPTMAPVLGSTPRKFAPICRSDVRFSSAIRTLRSTCCEVGIRIRLTIRGGPKSVLMLLSSTESSSGVTIPIGNSPPDQAQ